MVLELNAWGFIVTSGSFFKLDLQTMELLFGLFVLACKSYVGNSAVCATMKYHGSRCGLEVKSSQIKIET